MTIGIRQLQTIFALAGIVVETVRFDIEARAIVVDFTLAGQPHTKNIPFAEIEELFTETPITAPGASPVAQSAGGGIPAP